MKIEAKLPVVPELEYHVTLTKAELLVLVRVAGYAGTVAELIASRYSKVSEVEIKETLTQFWNSAQPLKVGF